jgi:hypothetical protein
MFVCRVLVGLTIKGTEDMRYLPVWREGVHYDTAVNQMEKPYEFVKFDDSHFYPAYLLRYASDSIIFN